MHWAPPSRLLLAWQIDAGWKYDASFETTLELRFEAEGTGTRVELEHRDLERFGDSAERLATQLGGGWPNIIARYAELANTN